VNPSALEDSHTVTPDRASPAALPLGGEGHLAVGRTACVRLTLALRAGVP
jgi:hypothetical protein